MNRDKVTKLALANGFKLKEQGDGSMALNEYVFAFAEALLQATDRISQEPSCYQWRMTGAMQTEWTNVCKEIYEGLIERYKGEDARGALEFRTLYVPTRTYFPEKTTEWGIEKGDNQVTCHTRVIEGVLCQWWGDSVPPEGVKLIDSLFETFIPWFGPDSPVSENTKVDVKLRGGSIMRNQDEASLRWAHSKVTSYPYEIVAWRLATKESK